MKFDELRALAHNIAASLADGNSLRIGCYDLRMFEDICRSSKGFIEVDLLTGASTGAQPPLVLARAFSRLSQALPILCKRHGTWVSAFHHLSARYLADRRFIVSIDDARGWRVTDEYIGSSGERARGLDPLGRIRRKRGIVVRPRNAGERHVTLIHPIETP